MNDLLRLCRNSTDKCNRLILSPTATTLQILTTLSAKREKDLTPKEKDQLMLIQTNLTKTGNDVVSEIFLSRACVESGVCSLFGKGEEVFSRWAADITKSNITKIVPLGGVSANGFVRELQITNRINTGSQIVNYTSSVILKSNQNRDSDNLYYEWAVGKYLNTLMDRFPIFCKTYGAYEYETVMEDMPKSMLFKTRVSDKEMMEKAPKTAFDVIKRLKPLGADAMLKSITRPEKICIVVQHVYNPLGFNVLLERFQILHETLKDESFLENSEEKMKQLADLLTLDVSEVVDVLNEIRGKTAEERAREIDELKREVLCILYQIYFVLALLPTFSHNDLHVGNIILAYAGDKFYRYHFDGVTFDSRYAVKLIDYGKGVFEGTPAFKEALDQIVKTLPIWSKLPEEKKNPFEMNEIQEEYGFPWLSLGTEKCISLDFRLLHFCIDTYKLLPPTFFCSLNRILAPKMFKTSICNNFTQKQFAVDGSLSRHLEFLGEANATESSCNRVTGSLMVSGETEPPTKSPRKKLTYPDIRDVAPELLKFIDQKHTYSGTCICDIYVSSTENMRVVWPTAGGKKTRKRKKTRVKRASLS
jgi:serine/threonine protein kinase